MKCDILVIGAGILGLSSAFHLKKQNPEKRIIVIDRLAGPGQGNTSKSAGGFRDIFTAGSNLPLAESTISWFDHLQGEQGYKVGFAHTTYLWLLSEKRHREMEDSFRTAESKGVDFKVYEEEQLNQLIPDLNTDFSDDDEAELMGLTPVKIGVQGLNCGIIDTDALTKAYESLFLELGGEIQYNTTAHKLELKPEIELGIPGEPFVWQEPVVSGVQTSRGPIEAGTTVVAAGAWSGTLLDPIGYPSMMKPKTRMIFVFKDPRLSGLYGTSGFNRYNVLPLTQLPNIKIYLKADLSEGSLWLGVSEDIGREFKLYDEPEAEERLYSENVYYSLTKHLPCFNDVRPINMWGGQRAINSVDKQPVVDSMTGMIYVGAASGNGIIKSDALGRIVAAKYSGETEAELFNGDSYEVSRLSIKSRKVDKEDF
jgi:FAD-dependent oxidoreductase domain-containing protein 1